MFWNVQFNTQVLMLLGPTNNSFVICEVITQETMEIFTTSMFFSGYYRKILAKKNLILQQPKRQKKNAIKNSILHFLFKKT